jgi:hypothetical protein
MYRTYLSGLLTLALAGSFLLPAQGRDGEKKEPPVKEKAVKTAPPPAKEEPPVIRLAPQGKKDFHRDLDYQLLPDPEDLTPGNAAVFWLRAAPAARNVRYKWTEKEWDWAKLPLKELPRKEVRAVLDKHAAALRLADRAARCDRCDWNWPPLTLQELTENLPLDDIQGTREIANLLSLRCRLELAERRFDKALYTLQTGFALARDVGLGPTLIQDLVGIAIGAIMLGRVEEWQQIPGSPNLYWALTALPSPLVDVRKSIRYELNTIYRSFPGLRELKKPQSAEQVRVLVEKVLDALDKLERNDVPRWVRQTGSVALTVAYYPQAKKALLAAGRTEKEIEAFTPLQVVVIYLLDAYDHAADDIRKWMLVPTWQALEPLKQFDHKMPTDPRFSKDPLLRSLMPAIYKVFLASVRSERQFAAARAAEALRLYAAAHGGKPPAKWADITEVPLPLDPVTGKGFDGFYQVKDGKGVLRVPPPAPMPELLTKHYELSSPAP